MTNLPKGTTIGTTNLQLGELIHMEFDFYNGTSFQVYTSMSTVVYANTIILWIFPTVSKGAQVLTIFFILTTLDNVTRVIALLANLQTYLLHSMAHAVHVAYNQNDHEQAY